MDALTPSIRFALYLDLMLLFGGAAFRLHALLRDPAAPRSGGTGTLVLSLLGLGLSVLGLVALAAAMSDTPLASVDRTALSLLGETNVGKAGMARMEALAFAALCGLFWRRWPRMASLGAIIGGGTALGTLAWSGHGAMDDGIAGWLHLGADIVHLLAAGIWVGAVAGLLGLALHRGPANAAHLRRLHGAMERFSAIGIAVVLLLVLTGFANSLFLTGAAPLGVILTSTWSALMLAKLALFAAMLALAAINRFRLTPALAVTPDATTLRRVRNSLLLETAAAVLILLLVGWLGMLEPPISVA